MAKLALVAASLLLLLAGGSRAVTLDSFFSDPTFKLFLQKAMLTASCLTDPAVTGLEFDLDLCPSLLEMLDAINNGAKDFPVTCEESCAGTFYSLTDTCLGELTTQFNQDPEPIGVLGSRFLEICADVHNGIPLVPTLAPAPAPAPAPSPA